MHPTTVGPFQIQRELGRGGMGEVYLARDTRLDREVAIKALPAHLASDPDRLSRFQREAKVLASLNHPGIGAIYGLEEAKGHQYLILEFIEGETLAARLSDGAIAIEETLTLAKQIAEALEVAHEKGVVHRDLKPGNVMVTPEGVVKVLDFGLARTADSAPSASDAVAQPDSPTVQSPAPIHSPSIPGAILGTAGYMSPEQARGKPVDKRSDIFSFGCVLYEMLSGLGPFPGETVTDSLGAILHREPDWGLLPPGTPARIRELLTKCLAKDRRNRLHDIGDARLELDRAIAGREWSATGTMVAASSGRRGWQHAARIALLSAALIGVGAAATWLVAKRQPPAAPAQAFHVSTTLPSAPAFASLVGIAPDARFLVFMASPELALESDKLPGVLMVRRLDRDETKVIDGTEGVRTAALSADGRWVAFSCVRDRAGSKLSLKKVGLSDGQSTGGPVSLCELAPGYPNLCWSSDREILISDSRPESAILAVPAEGGEPRVVVREESEKSLQGWGDFRPLDGKSILATRWSLIDQTLKQQVEVVDLASGKRTVVIPNARAAQFLPEGYLLAMRNRDTVLAARFDPDTLQVNGSPMAVLSGGPFDDFCFSRNGTLAMVARPAGASSRRLAWIDEQGQAVPIPGSARAFESFSVSPDGGRVVSTLAETGQGELPSELWVQDVGRRTVTRLPTQGVPMAGGVWSNDGQRIAYGVVGGDECAIWERRGDGAGESVKLHSVPGSRTFVIAGAWSPDGKILAFVRVDIGTNNADVCLLERAADSTEWTARPYLESKASEGPFWFSPDGKWVRFISDESGRAELYVQRFTGKGTGTDDAKAGRVQVSTNGAGGASWWSRDGKEIRYLDTDGQVMSVQVQTDPSFSASLPKLLYSIKHLKTRGAEFAADGRLMVLLEGEGEQISKIDLVVNFVEELRAKMATAK